MVVFLSAALMAVAASAAVVVIETQNEYYGVCSKLSGFPGFLQRNGLLQTGTCKTLPGGTVCNAGSSCTANGKSGTCKNTAKPGQGPMCSCVVATP